MLILVVLILLILVYCYGTRTFGYWAKRGIKHDTPIAFLGTAKRQLLQEISHTDAYHEMYEKYPSEKFVGYYLTTTPILILRDPELIKRVLVTDFVYFHERSLHPVVGTREPMLYNLFSSEGDLWKLLRQRMTPAFSSGKLKAMFPLIVERTLKLQQIAAEVVSTRIDTEVDVRDLMARYTTDFIGACVFGLDTDALNDENSMFRQLGRRIFNTTTRDAVVLFCKFTIPSVFRHLHYFSEFVEKNMIDFVKNVMKQRDYKPSGRHDFVDLLLELREKGKIIGESMTKKELDGSPSVVEMEFDDKLIAAQLFVFFAAGFETSSSSSSYTLHQLAYHPEYQEKCQQEIDEVLARYDNKLCYEAVQEMKYLQCCYNEALRLFPPVAYLMRKCLTPYNIPGTDITLDPGVKVVVSAKSLHLDPQYWDEPEQFRPDRFHPDNVGKINKNVYMPYGVGLRNCIGERLGVMQSLAGLAALLSQFSFAPSKNTIRHPPVDPAVYIVQSVRGGLPLAIVPRKKDQ